MAQSEYVKRDEFERTKDDLHSRINKTNIRIDTVDKERIKDKGELSGLIGLLSQSIESINTNTKEMNTTMSDLAGELRTSHTDTNKRIDKLETRTTAIEENKNHINSIVIALIAAGVPALVQIVHWLGPVIFPTIQ